MARRKRPSKSLKSSLATAKVQQAELYSRSVRPLNSTAIIQRSPKLVSPLDNEVRFSPNDTRWKERQFDEYEDMARHWMQDFALREVTDMQYEASKVVQAINHGHPRPEVIRLKRNYLDAFELANLCFQCGAAIRVKRSSLYAETLKVSKKRPKVHKYERGQYAIPHYERKELAGLPYGVVLSHFEWFWADDAHTKAFFCYIDGSNRFIQKRTKIVSVTRPAKTHWERKRADTDGNITRRTKTQYFAEILPDGSERTIVPNQSYRVWGSKCTCPFRRREFVKFNALDRM